MSLPSEIFRNDYEGDGTLATYVYSFKVFKKEHLKVIISRTDILAADVTLVEGVDYTVTGVGTAGGTVVLQDGTGLLVGGKLPTGKNIGIIRQVPLTQLTELNNQGRFNPRFYEDALDYMMMALQQQQDALNRSLTVLESQPTTGLTFPSPAVRAGMLLGFDSNGDPIAVSAGGAVSGSWQTLIDAANYTACRTLLGFAGTGGTVQTANIDPAGLGAAALASSAVTTAKIQNLAVTTAKVADNAITDAKLAAGAGGEVGDITTSMRSSKTGWLLCDGSAVSRTTYAALYAIIGTANGQGDGSTTFNLPDFRGAFARGLDSRASVTGSGSAASNNATFTAHPYTKTGARVRLSSGTLSGLSTSTTYYVIVIDANTLAFASSRANALAGTKIAITGSNSAVIVSWEDPDASSRVAAAPGGATGKNLGSFQEDDFESHTHALLGTAGPGGGNGLQYNFSSQAGVADASPSNTGGNETRPTSIAVNYFIKY